MMILDAAELENASELEADICIVGAGAAGIALALKLVDAGPRVLLLEAGGLEDEADTQSLYEGEVADGDLHPPADKYRQRRFGGSTGAWGGRCMPFDAIDFEKRPWIDLSGWPISLDDLLPFYPEANALCEAGRFEYTAERAFPNGMRPMLKRFAGADFTDNTLERFSCPTDFGRRYRKRLELSSNVRVALHANVTELRTADDGGAVTFAVFKTLTGRTHTVKARHFVLASGGLEIPRLLLASRDHHAEGIGNGYDQVGRHYMCHLAGTIGAVRLNGARQDVRHGYDISDEGIYCRRRLALTDEAQRRLGVGNFIARLHHPDIPDPSHRTGALSALFLAKPFIGYEYGKRLHSGDSISLGQWLGHARNLLLDCFGTAGFLLHWLRDRTLAARKFPTVIVRPRSNVYSLDFHAEQAPNPQSRVRLSAQRDPLGMQRIAIDWRYQASDIETIRAAVAALASDMKACGAGVIDYDPNEVEQSALRYGAYGGHHIGTTRMALDPRHGVVDADCRVHGMRNLFVAGSAAFATSSQANPTLTIVALTLRLAAHLKRQFPTHAPAM